MRRSDIICFHLHSSDDVSVPTASGALNTAPEGSDSASFNAIKTGLRQRLASDDHSRLGGRNRQSSNASLFSVTSATSNPPSRSRKDSAASTVSLQPPPSGATPISAAQLRPRATSSNKLHKRRPGQSHDVSNQQHPQHEEVRGHAASRSISSVIEAQPELLSPHGFQPYGTSSQEEDAEFSSPVSDLGSFSAAGPSDQGSMVGQISPREKASGFGLGATSPRLESERLVVYHDDEDDTDAFGQSKSRRKVPRYSWLALAHWILSSPIYAPLRFLSFIPLVRGFRCCGTGSFYLAEHFHLLYGLSFDCSYLSSKSDRRCLRCFTIPFTKEEALILCRWCPEIDQAWLADRKMDCGSGSRVQYGVERPTEGHAFF